MKGSIRDACALEAVLVPTTEDPRNQAFWQAGALWTRVTPAVSQDAFSLARALLLPSHACAVVFWSLSVGLAYAGCSVPFAGSRLHLIC